jgi:hypothetical protein
METTPLLQEVSAKEPGVEIITLWRARAERLRNHFSTYSIIYISAFFLLTIDTPMFMIESSKLRALEEGVCREYYRKVDLSVILPDNSIPEKLCKVHEIQQSLVKLRGVHGFLEEIPGIV